MRKSILSLASALIMLSAVSLPATAVDIASTDAMLPVDIVIDLEANEIRKVYDLSPDTDPSTLPMDPFDRDGIHYECADILREVVIGSETQNVTQTETVESSDNSMETILGLLPQDREVTTEEGFSGTLHLDIDSIKTEVSGYGSKTSPVTVTRSYPNLSDADTNHLPKTISEGGRTLTLQDVQWQTDNTYNANDYEIGDRFTAVCTYSGTKTTSYVKGYTTTADYVGEVYRTGVTVIRYTVIFNGTPIAVEEPESSAWPAWTIAVLPALGTLLAGTGITYAIMKRKERKSYAYQESADHSGDRADAYDDNDAGGTGD